MMPRTDPLNAHAADVDATYIEPPEEWGTGEPACWRFLGTFGEPAGNLGTSAPLDAFTPCAPTVRPHTPQTSPVVARLRRGVNAGTACSFYEQLLGCPAALAERSFLGCDRDEAPVC